jgi:XTP/dITP diphosphohydrolase
LNRPHVTTLIIATRNAHKVGEIRAILSDQLGCLALDDLPGAPAAVEDADTFAGNAAKKAVKLAQWLATAEGAIPGPRPSTLLVLADDSGLEVDALHGAPGVHSARFAALGRGTTGNSTDAENNANLLRLLEEVPIEKRTARFRCVLALAEVNLQSSTRTSQLFEGVCEGRIDFRPHGQGGFGYDPLFVPKGFEQSFAELGEAVKNRISHRAKALAGLRAFLVERGPAVS